MKPILTVWIMLVGTSMLQAQSSSSRTLGEIKEWQFNTRHGDIALKLSAMPNAKNGRTVLSLLPAIGSVPTVVEEADLLRQVLDEVASLGYDPKKIQMISTWLQNTEYRSGVEQSVTRSGKWKSCVRQKYCNEAQVVANQYLKAVDAFKSFDDVLRAHGLERRSVRVDDMAVGRVDDRVSCSGLIVIALGQRK